MPHTESNLGLQGAKARAGDLGRPQEIFRAGGWANHDPSGRSWTILVNTRLPEFDQVISSIVHRL